MNSCSDTDLNLNSSSGSCIVMYHINTEIKEQYKNSQLKMGRDLNAWFICMFCRAVGLRWALIPGRCLSPSSGGCVVWWCDIWSSASSLFILCRGWQCVEGSVRGYGVSSMHVDFTSHGSATEEYGPLFFTLYSMACRATACLLTSGSFCCLGIKITSRIDL